MGHRIYFTTAIDLARRMAQCLAEDRLAREIKNLTRPELLIIDEVGYLTLEKTHAGLLFQAICESYEKREPIILTSNKAFADWAKAFAEQNIMNSVALDRLPHRSTVLNIRGDSYRLKEKLLAKSSGNKVTLAA
jgi:DNA replication protein DnaC